MSNKSKRERRRSRARKVTQNPAITKTTSGPLGQAGGGRVFEVRAEQFTGPLPHPELLARYEAIQPGIANRIVQQFEHQGAHRRDMEKTFVNATLRSQTRGQYMAFVLFAAVLGIAFWLFDHNHTALATGFVVADVLGAVGIFLRRDRDEDPKKHKDRQ